MPRKINPYAYVTASFHEAGHAIVAHLLGWPVERLWVDKDGTRGDKVFARTIYDPVVIPSPLLAPNGAERKRRIQATRNAMAVVSAGALAASIHQKHVKERGYTSRLEKSGYSSLWEGPISFWFPHCPDNAKDPGSDYCLVVRDAQQICMVQGLDDPSFPWDLRTKEAEKKANELVLAEIVRAEKKAEKLLRRYWQVVTHVAEALMRRKSGEMTGRQMSNLIGHHFEAPKSG